MKKIGFCITMMILLVGSTQAQDRREEIMERVESRRIAFITDKLDLTPEEAQVFWPLHNAYQDEVKEIRSSGNFREDFMNGNFDADKALMEMISNEEKELLLMKKYALKMKDIIGAKKTMMYYHFERKFKEAMLRELQRRRGGEPGRRG